MQNPFQRNLEGIFFATIYSNQSLFFILILLDESFTDS